MAPEVHYSDDPSTLCNRRAYNHKADVWSLAVVILEMVLGQLQFFVDFSKSVPDVQYHRRVPYDAIRDKYLRHLICSVRSSSRRSSLYHPFFFLY